MQIAAFTIRLKTVFLLVGIILPLTAQFDIRQLDPPASFEAEFGLTFTGINDLNGDGHYELVVGSPIDSVNGIYAAGRVYVVSGTTGAVIFTIESPNPEVFGLFGRHVAKSDDTNNDGFDDIIVAAWKEDHSEIEDAGRAYLFSGVDGSLLHTFISVEPAMAEFWYDSPICGVSDVNSDDAGDVAIGIKLGSTK
ncbi:MAG: FG-GAP repeat protein [Calditrichota bacterium]